MNSQLKEWVKYITEVIKLILIIQLIILRAMTLNFIDLRGPLNIYENTKIGNISTKKQKKIKSNLN